MYSVLLIVHTIVVLLLIGIILIQRSDQDGMGLSGGGNQFLSGRAQANVLTRATAILATLFIVSSLTLAILSSRMSGSSIVDQAVETPATGQAVPKPDAAPAPTVPKPE